MEYLVSDIVNCNVAPHCPVCGKDNFWPALNLSMDYQPSLSKPPTVNSNNNNNNPMPEFDLLPLIDSTKCQFCLRLQQSLSQITNTGHSVGIEHLCEPFHGPNSGTNISHHTPNTFCQQHVAGISFKDPNSFHGATSGIHVHQSLTSCQQVQSDRLHTSGGEQSSYAGTDGHNENISTDVPPTAGCPECSTRTHPPWDRISSVGIVNDITAVGNSGHSKSGLCCFRRIRTAADESNDFSENGQTFHSCTCWSNTSHGHVQSSSTRHELDLPQHEQVPSGRHELDQPQHEQSSSARHESHQRQHLHDNNNGDLQFPISDDGRKHLSQTIAHNTHHNTVTTSCNIQTLCHARIPQNARRIPYNDGIPQTGDTFHVATVSASPLSLDLTLSPSQIELYNLHDLDTENNDLSKELILSLHLRNYHVGEVLGKGISSTVRRVTEKATGVEYAVKIIDISGEKGELVQVEQVKKDTFREITILRMCAGHSNIIELHDVFETPTFIFLVFEICKKGELFDYLTSVVSLSEKRTRIFMRQLIEAVAFFHEKNIVHRDLKPENILLDDNLNIKVSDFGFATVVRDGEELSELCGTPGYLAPEVLAHSMYENVSGYRKEVDMWACGVIMYTLLCGAPPFWNRRQMMMLRAIMSADYTFNTPEWDDISEAPKNLIRNLLLVNPGDRLTAQEALKHPFLQTQVPEEKKFKALKKFRAGVHCVVFYLRLVFYFKHPPPVSVQTVRDNPYGVKIMRKVIDTCAFGMYKHWVKRVDNQNRAALFEHTLRDDWKHALITIDGIRA